jgi:DNA polymerase-3 subunit delta
MPTIAYNAIAEHLKGPAVDKWPAVTLIYGEEMLCRRAFDALMDALIPETERALGVDTFDGGEDGVAAVLSSLNTYALLASTKVVVLREARLFYSATAKQGLREKMIQAGQGGNLKKASRPLLNLMALEGLQFEDLTLPARRKKIVDDVDGRAAAWFDPLVTYCQDKGLRIPDKRDDADLLKTAMQKGFPEGHRLVITTDLVDRRKALYKAIDETGMVVDCSVPKGETRADRMAQDAVMQATMDEALAQSGKRLDTKARRRLVDWTGFDLRTLAGSLEKLINFVGDRETITDTDVSTVLKRTRKDPIFEFTNAVADRNLDGALFYMHSLLVDGMHPLQLLAAVANQLRRLLLAKDFIIRDRGRSWSSRMAFPQFKSTTFKAIQADDATHASLIEDWETILKAAVEGKKRKKSPASDLVLARNPRSPFPVYQTLKKADNFSMQALALAVRRLSEADVRMKSTGQAPRLLLESVLIDLCRNSENRSGDDCAAGG